MNKRLFALIVMFNILLFSSCSDEISHPAMPTCGNGQIDGQELCDSANGLVVYAEGIQCPSGELADLTLLSCDIYCRVDYGLACEEPVVIDCSEAEDGDAFCKDQSTLLPYCLKADDNSGHCVACKEDSHCPENLPICNSSNVCVDKEISCSSAEDGDALCRRVSPDKPYCSTSSSCVECLNSMHCPEEAPICDSNNRCQKCSDDLPCADGKVCDVSGKCFDCVKQAEGTYSPYCLGTMPICNWDTNKCSDCVAVNKKEVASGEPVDYDACYNNSQGVDVCVDEGENYGACEPKRCEKGERRCSQGVMERCYGNKWVVDDTETACTKDEICIQTPESAATCEKIVCTHDYSYCKNNQLHTCVSATNVQTQVNCDEEFCDPQDLACVPRVCNGSVCDNNVLKMCDSVNNKIVDIACGEEYCDLNAGSCVPRVCKEGDRKCNGNAVLICDESTNTFKTEKLCLEPYFCNLSSPDHCARNACDTVGETICQDNKVYSCVKESGVNVLRVPAEGDCEASAKFCEESGTEAKCVDRVCTVAGKSCDANVLVNCNTIQNTVVRDDCNNDYCDSTQLACVSRVCEKDGVTCEGNVRTTCDRETNTLTQEDCGADYCDPTKAACVPRVCMVHGSICENNKVRTCDTKNNTLTYEDCAGDFCNPKTSACEARVCTESGTVCKNNAVEICDTSKNTLTVQACGDQYCDSTSLACVPRVCNLDGAVRCVDNMVKTCDYANNEIDLLDDCSLKNQYCDPGTLTCEARVCSVNGQKTCDGNVLKTCDTTNNELLSQDCLEDFCDATLGACVPRICKESDGWKCEKNAIVVCNEGTNSLDVIEDCKEQFCRTSVDGSVNPVCEPRVCTVHGATECKEDDVYICNTQNNTFSLSKICSNTEACQMTSPTQAGCIACSSFVTDTTDGHIGCSFYGARFPVRSSTQYVLNVSNPGDVEAQVTVSSYVGAAKTYVEYKYAIAAHSDLGISLSVFNPINQIASTKDHAIIVESTQPISAYLRTKGGALTEEIMLIPRRSLGNEYLSNTLKQEYAQHLIIIGTEDNTTVKILSKANFNEVGATVELPTMDVEKSYTINKYDLISLYPKTNEDAALHRISSDKPISVTKVLGEMRLPFGFAYIDFGIAQVHPVQSWGKTHIVTPMRIQELEPDGDYKASYISLVAKEATTVTVLPYNETINLEAGQIYLYTDLPYTISPMMIISEKPIEVFQYFLASMNKVFGKKTEGSLISTVLTTVTREFGDPSLTQIVPVEQYTKHFKFNAETAAADIGRSTSYLMIISPENASASLTYEGESSVPVDFPADQHIEGYKFAYVKLDLNKKGSVETSEPSTIQYYHYTNNNVTSCFRALGANFKVINP